jgi:hypothetical protein
MKHNELDLLIDQLYNFENGIKPFYDGIINEEMYNQAKVKILWVCKEPYDKRNDSGDFSLRDEINSDPTGYFKIKIMRRIALASYCVLNDSNYEQALNDDNVALALKSIAYINLNKLPALTNSSGRERYFSQVYSKCKLVLLKQIESYKPDIIIFGNTCYHFIEDLGIVLSSGKNLEYQYKSIFYHNNQLLIDSCHPSFRSTITEENFCKSIYEAVQIWLKSKELK